MREKQAGAPEVSVVIPNYNGRKYLKTCLDSLNVQTMQDFETILVDNGSQDGSLEFLQEEYPWVKAIALSENTGFCGAVNRGIRAAKGKFVVLLNNDTQAEEHFLEELSDGIKRHSWAFSGAAMMLQFQERNKIDDAGNYYNALGWAFARGKGKPAEKYQKEEKIFSSCGGAVIYRKELFEQIGFFDEEHFAYLEDTDIGYRARIAGYENWYFPKAKVYHVGSGTSGSRYNQFKIRYSSRNNIYLLYKNMPFFQLLLNMPFLIVGFGIKTMFFAMKGYGREYLAGIKNGCSICRREKKVTFSWKNLGNYIRIQIELWWNIIRRLRG